MAAKRLLKFRSSQLLLGLSAWKIPRGGNCQFVVSKRATLCCRNFSFVLIVVVSSKSNFTWVNSLAFHEQNSWQIENFWREKLKSSSEQNSLFSFLNSTVYWNTLLALFISFPDFGKISYKNFGHSDERYITCPDYLQQFSDYFYALRK